MQSVATRFGISSAFLCAILGSPTILCGDESAVEVRRVEIDIDSDVTMHFVPIPAGRFVMGSPEDEPGRDGDDPQHEVVITRPFLLGQHEVTQLQWRAVMEKDPSGFTGDERLPVDSVEWDEAMEFCRRLSEKIHRAARLPSEAEWEYACRAGTKTAFYFGERLRPRDANYDWTEGGADGDTSLAKTTPVGSFRPNGFGLFDMHGNVREWCLDWYGRDYYLAGPKKDPRGPKNGVERVLRGGSWDSYARRCRSAYRGGRRSGDRDETIGFRVLLEIPDESSSSSRR